MRMAKSLSKKYIIKDTVIVDNIYKKVSDSFDNDKQATNRLKACIGKFMHDRHDELYDYAPVDRIFFKTNDENAFFNAVKLNMKDITNDMTQLYYWKQNELQACKDPFSITMLMTLRWFIINEKKLKPSDREMVELCFMYLAFSGKFYASCHYKWFKNYTPKREVMDYVVNYMLSEKFDIAKTKSVFGAVRNLTYTWYTSYKDELIGKDLTDERVSYIVHQLHSRIYAFLRNIAKLYYEAYDKKLYLNKESDRYDDGAFRIANNNSTIASSVTEKTITYMTSTQVNMALCYSSSTSGVDPREIKAIIDNILNDTANISKLRDVINIMITDFMRAYPEYKTIEEITGVKFIAHSIAMRPNTKDKDMIYLKNTILEWLNTSARYRSIKTPATKNNYYKGILSYIALTINTAVRD